MIEVVGIGVNLMESMMLVNFHSALVEDEGDLTLRATVASHAFCR